MYILASDLFLKKMIKMYLRLEIRVVRGEFYPLIMYFYLFESKSDDYL